MKTSFGTFIRQAILFAFVGAGLGCSEQIQQGLDERQANEVQSVLLDQGFDAKKVKTPGKKTTWSIEVPKSQATQAIRVLAREKLPRPAPPDFDDSPGLVPTPAEERTRAMARTSAEISQTLEAIDGVSTARVHIVLPPSTRVGQQPGPSKASVYLRVRQESVTRILAMKRELKELVAGGVENLNPEDVSLVITEISHATTPRRNSTVAAANDDGRWEKVPQLLAVIFSILAVGIVGFVFLRRFLNLRHGKDGRTSAQISTKASDASGVRKVA